MKRLCETLNRSRRLIEVRITTFTIVESTPWCDAMTDSMLECFEAIRGVEKVVFPISCGREVTYKHGLDPNHCAITGTDKARGKAKRVMTGRP